MKQLILILGTLFLLNCSKDPLNIQSKTLSVKDTLVILDNLHFDVSKRDGGVDRNQSVPIILRRIKDNT